MSPVEKSRQCGDWLFNLSKEAKQKQRELKSKVEKEEGVSFSPKLFVSPSRVEEVVKQKGNMEKRNEEYERQKIEK